MEGNKDEAFRCVRIAEEAIAAGDKARAAKFIKIALRLNQDLQVDHLLAACDSLDSGASSSSREKSAGESRSDVGKEKLGGMNGERSYTEEHVQLIREVKRNKDYYAILGVEKTCPVEEVRKAYRKLSLKVHPDKNKAPGSEEAFKIVSKAFKCLSEVDSRRHYDQTAFVDEFENNQQHNVRRRTTRTRNDFVDDDFDPDEIFRAFFGESDDMFRTSQVYRTRGACTCHREEVHNGGPDMFLIRLFLYLVLLWLVLGLLLNGFYNHPGYRY